MKMKKKEREKDCIKKERTKKSEIKENLKK